MPKPFLALGAAALALIACGRVNFELTGRSTSSLDGGQSMDATGVDVGLGADGSSALDDGSVSDVSPSGDARVADGGTPSSLPTCDVPDCMCPPGPEPCELFCFAEPCVVNCSGATQCTAYCWPGVMCSASYEGASGGTRGTAPEIVFSTAGLGVNDLDSVFPDPCGSSCTCPTDCTEVLGLQLGDCGGRTPETGSCEMTCDTPRTCSLYCGEFVGECAVQCGTQRCIGVANEWVSCVDGACRSGPPD